MKNKSGLFVTILLMLAGTVCEAQTSTYLGDGPAAVTVTTQKIQHKSVLIVVCNPH